MVNEREKELINKYRKLWQESGSTAPNWALQIPPAIPAIGSKMKISIISFASCENFSKKDIDGLAYIRKDKWFPLTVSRSRWPTKEQYFPNRHINPFDRGNQYIITWFALKCLGHEMTSDISEFSEQISTANPFKFTIDRKHHARGIDPNGILHTTASLPYLIADLHVIQPEVVIIPKTRFDRFESYHVWKTILEEACVKKSVKFIFIKQAVPTVINDPENQNNPSIVEDECRSINDWIKKCGCPTTMKGHLSYLQKQWKEKPDEWMTTIDPGV